MAIAPLRLTRLTQGNPIVDGQGRPTSAFMRLFNDNLLASERATNAVVEALNAAEAAQLAAETAQAAAEAAQASADAAQGDAGAAGEAESLRASYPANYAPPLIIANTAGDITIANHDRVYGNSTLNPTVSVVGDILSTGFTNPDRVRIYYDDPTRAGGVVSYQFTLDPQVAAQGGDRHVVGAVTMPTIGVQVGDPVQPPGYT